MAVNNNLFDNTAADAFLPYGDCDYYCDYKNVHRVRKKRGHVIFNYNSRILWSIFIIFVPLETGVNT